MSMLRVFVEAKAATRLEPDARPWRKDPPGATEAFLLLHGFTGIPKELEGIGEALAESGYASSCPRYPGHGSDRADFLATGARDWLRRAFDAYLELRAEYGTVHVCGHSMGGAIATIVAASFDAPRLILLAPAFRISKPGTRLAPFLAPFVPVLRRGRPNTETDPARQRLHPEYWRDDLVAGAAELLKIVRAARRSLPRVGSEILVIVGSKDLSVPPSVADYVESLASRAASFEKRSIEGAGHLFPFDADSGRTRALVAEWLGRGG